MVNPSYDESCIGTSYNLVNLQMIIFRAFLSSRYYLHYYDAQAVYICLFCELAPMYVLRSHVSTA